MARYQREIFTSLTKHNTEENEHPDEMHLENFQNSSAKRFFRFGEYKVIMMPTTTATAP